MLDPKFLDFVDEIVPMMANITGIPESDLRSGMIARAEYVALPSSQAAIAKAEAKRQRKGEKLRKQLGEPS